MIANKKLFILLALLHEIPEKLLFFNIPIRAYIEVETCIVIIWQDVHAFLILHLFRPEVVFILEGRFIIDIRSTGSVTLLLHII